MIDLTPLDVRKKKEDFRRAVRGYDAGQVDSFLDVVADRFEELVRELRSATERVKSLEEQLERYRERERALNDALLAAQELREEARSQAERDSAVRLREAESHAEAILLEADQAIRHAQRRLKELRAYRVQFLRSSRALLQRFSENMELEEARLESEPYDFSDLLEKLQAEDPPEGEVGPSSMGVGEVPREAGRAARSEGADGPARAEGSDRSARRDASDGPDASPRSGSQEGPEISPRASAENGPAAEKGDGPPAGGAASRDGAEPAAESAAGPVGALEAEGPESAALRSVSNGEGT